MKKVHSSLVALLLILPFNVIVTAETGSNPGPAPAPPFTDYRYEKPGTIHKITPKDLPAPNATKSASNWAKVVQRPANAWPQAPAGFKVELFATGLDEPREIITAPNGDIFLAESHLGQIKVFRGMTGDGKP